MRVLCVRACVRACDDDDEEEEEEEEEEDDDDDDDDLPSSSCLAQNLFSSSPTSFHDFMSATSSSTVKRSPSVLGSSTGVLPPSSAGLLRPSSRSTCSTFLNRISSARSLGVCPLRFFVFGSAFASRSLRQHSTCPQKTASCSGVSPCVLSGTFVAHLSSASSNLTMSSCPARAARCSAELPPGLVALISTFAFSILFSVCTSPLCAAMRSAASSCAVFGGAAAQLAAPPIFG